MAETNLASKFSPRLDMKFTQKSLVAGAVNHDYDFDGVDRINVWSPVTKGLVDYTRSGTNRFGTPTEMQDTVQEMVLTRDRSFSITIDKGNLKEQLGVKQANRMLKAEIEERYIPEVDKYSLKRFMLQAGKSEALTADPTKDDICDALQAGLIEFGNNNVPADGRVIFIGWTQFGNLRLSKQFMGVDALAGQSLVHGALGTFMGAQVIAVPDEYLKYNGTSVCYFLEAHKSAILQVQTVKDYYQHSNPPGINGALLEGRFIYDAFVLGAKCGGVYAAVKAAAKQATPTLTYAAASKSVTAASAGASSIRYTLDGTAPRYSKSAAVITGASGTADLTAFAGQTVTIRAAAYSGTLFTSPVKLPKQAVAE